MRAKQLLIAATVVFFFFTGRSVLCEDDKQPPAGPFKKSTQLYDVEQFRFQIFNTGSWHIIQSSPGENSGSGVLFFNSDRDVTSPPGPWSSTVQGAWKTSQRVIHRQKKKFDGGKYYWWRKNPRTRSGKDQPPRTSPFLTEATILCRLSPEKDVDVPPWRKYEQMNEHARNTLKRINLPDGVRNPVTMYSEQQFSPYFMIPRSWNEHVKSALKTYRRNRETFTGKITEKKKKTLHSYVSGKNPLLACKAYQRLITNGHIEVSTDFVTDTSHDDFRHMFFLYLWFKTFGTSKNSLQKMLKVARKADSKKQVKALLQVVFSAFKPMAKNMEEPKKFQPFFNEFIRILLKKKKSMQLDEDGLNFIEANLKKNFPEASPRESN